MENRICKRCNISKPLADYQKHVRVTVGWSYKCKICKKEEQQIRGYTKEGVIATIYNSQKQSSKSRGHTPPEYSLNELKEATLAMPLFDTLYQTWVDSGYDTLLKPSYDRENDYIGYTKDNIELKTWGENKDKGYKDRRNGINNKVSKEVIQLTLDGEIVNTFVSTHSASRITGFNRGSIASACRGTLKTCSGFKWNYK